MRIVEVLKSKKPDNNLYSIWVDPNTGATQRGPSPPSAQSPPQFFHSNCLHIACSSDTVSLGALGDSFYEYLVKVWVATKKSVDWLGDMYFETAEAILDRMAQKTKPSQLDYLAEIQHGRINKKVDHLVRDLWTRVLVHFWLKTCGFRLVLRVECLYLEQWIRISLRLREDIWSLQRDLVNFAIKCMQGRKLNYHRNTWRRTTREISNLPKESRIAILPFALVRHWQFILLDQLIDLFVGGTEAIEAIFYLYRVTKDEKYRDMGWEMFKVPPPIHSFLSRLKFVLGYWNSL